jgi:hypothetical protein
LFLIFLMNIWWAIGCKDRQIRPAPQLQGSGRNLTLVVLSRFSGQHRWPVEQLLFQLEHCSLVARDTNLSFAAHGHYPALGQLLSRNNSCSILLDEKNHVELRAIIFLNTVYSPQDIPAQEQLSVTVRTMLESPPTCPAICKNVVSSGARSLLPVPGESSLQGHSCP